MSNQTGQKKPRLLILDCSLRLSLIPITIASLWLTVTNHENNIDYGNIRFANFMGLKYMACTTALAAGYALVALICNWVRCLVSKSWVFFLSDQVMAYLLVTSGSAVMEILYLAYKGDIEVSWSKACSTYGSFCHRLKIALLLHFVALIFFLVLAIISAYRAFSVYEAPITTINEEKEDAI
ncbi:hypothetical protein V2J09_017337 [Rumex salicifolius]